MNKKVVVLFSGGLDSTYLVYKNLEEGNEVLAKYIEIKNNDTKSKMELFAISCLEREFKEDYKDKFTFEKTISIDIWGSHSSYLPQLPVFLTSLLLTSIKDNIVEIQLGYTLNDDAVSWVNDIQKFWSSIKPFINNGKLPKLIFPLLKTSKKEYDLPEKYKQHVVWCECPNYSHGCFKPCGECTPCKKYEKLGIFNKFDNSNEVITNERS